MILSLAVTAGLLLQVAPDPVRVWRADSIAYVQLREPGHLLLLHADALGRLQVLFPFAPDDGTSISGDVAFAVPLPPEAQGNPSTFVAIRSRWPFDFAALRMGFAWNYYDALLLQPTAGDPLAAVLDIAERVTGGRPYAYGVVTYSREGGVVARGPVRQPEVCLSCVRPGRAVAAAPAAAQTMVDCSNASLTNSFCGVNSGSVSITGAPAPQVIYQPAPAPAAVYIPYFIPRGHGLRPRFEPRPSPPPARLRSQGVASPIAPRLVVPSAAQLRAFGGRKP